MKKIVKDKKGSAAKTCMILGIACAILLSATACSGDNAAAEAAEKYTCEVAQAIVEGSWKIAGSIILGLIFHAIIS